MTRTMTPRTMTPVRQRTPSAEIEDAVVEAALRLLAASGPASLTVRGLAAEADIAPMGIYNHFGDKNGVIDAVFRRGFEALTEAVAVADAIPDPLEALRAGLEGYRQFALGHRTTYAVMFLREVPGFIPTEESLVVAVESFAVLVRSIERGMHSGDLRSGDVQSIAQQLWSAAHGAVSLELAEMCLVDDVAGTYRSLVDTMIDGSGRIRAEAAGRAAPRARAR
ncbi:MAG: TetR/AcrR family transcriptional regulator [Acidobacteria bacterium]|nr:TetR/AcrR family transcriptional regulator [Acidobacteriota bacterium]